MHKKHGHVGAVLAALILAACGGESSTTSIVASSTARGTLAQNPPLRIASLDAASFHAELNGTASGQQLLQLTGAPACGVDFYYLEYWTVGGAGESTKASGALMVPTGAAPACSGARPLLLYAHGTQTDRSANIADITNASNSEGALIAAMFAAQGYIVVAPNYVGYDLSTLPYHPYLNAAQQSDEMIDVLAAARTALPMTFAASTTDNGKLFLTGYSEGGFVAMATQRALEALGQTTTAAAPMSGPYALEAFGDAIFYGNVNLGSTVFAPLLTTSYQKAYGNIYSATNTIYSASYASGIDTLLPSTVPLSALYASGKLPLTALFDSATPIVTIPGDAAESTALTAALAVPASALFALGFGSPPLIINSYRVSYVLDAAANPDGAVPTPRAGVPLAATAPTQALRKAFYLNDLRGGDWAPNSPTLLCGGDQDPTVFFSTNTLTMQAFWSGLPAGLITVLDVNASPAGAFAAVQAGFQSSEAQQLAYYQSAAGGGLTLAQAQQQLVQNYHASVAPFCAVAARSFFSQF